MCMKSHQRSQNITCNLNLDCPEPGKEEEVLHLRSRKCSTYPLLELVPLGGAVPELVVVKGQCHLPQEVVASKRVIVPHCHPQSACLQLTLGDVILRKTRR